MERWAAPKDREATDATAPPKSVVLLDMRRARVASIVTLLFVERRILKFDFEEN